MANIDMSVSKLKFIPAFFNDTSGELTVYADVRINETKYREMPIFRLTCEIDPNDQGDGIGGRVTLTEPWYNPLLLKAVPTAFFRNLRTDLHLKFIERETRYAGTAVYKATRAWLKKQRIPA